MLLFFSCGLVQKTRSLRSPSVLGHELVNFRLTSELHSSVNSGSDGSWTPIGSTNIKKSDHTDYLYAERTKIIGYSAMLGENGADGEGDNTR